MRRPDDWDKQGSFSHVFFYVHNHSINFNAEAGRVVGETFVMENYTIQFRYNGKEHSFPFQSSEVLKPTMSSLSLLLAAEDAAKDVLITYNLMVKGETLSSIRGYGNGGDINIDLNINE